MKYIKSFFKYSGVFFVMSLSLLILGILLLPVNFISAYYNLLLAMAWGLIGLFEINNTLLREKVSILENFRTDVIRILAKPEPKYTTKPKTFFLDYDATLIVQNSENHEEIVNNPAPELLPGTVEKINKWRAEGGYIVITTAREKIYRAQTIKHLDMCGIYYDELLMGITSGLRILVNNSKKNGDLTAKSYSLPYNYGLRDIMD